MMPAFASMSSDSGSIPFWLITTKFFPFSGVHMKFLKSTIARTLSSVNFRSAATSSSRSCAVLYTNVEFASLGCSQHLKTYLFSYSSDTFRIRM